MHELGIAEQIARTVVERARIEKATTVRKVVLEAGEMTLIVPDSLEFYFKICVKDTIAADAILETIEIPATACCEECKHRHKDGGFVASCPKCHGRLQWLTGNELRIKHMEVI